MDKTKFEKTLLFAVRVLRSRTMGTIADLMLVSGDKVTAGIKAKQAELKKIDEALASEDVDQLYDLIREYPEFY
jgi:hypothetical protein